MPAIILYEWQYSDCAPGFAVMVLLRYEAHQAINAQKCSDLTSLPHASQVSISMLKTRFKRLAQVIEARFSTGVWSTSSTGWHFLCLPRRAGVTFARYLLLGANTPWKRVRLTLGWGIKATSLEIKSASLARLQLLTSLKSVRIL